MSSGSKLTEGEGETETETEAEWRCRPNCCQLRNRLSPPGPAASPLGVCGRRLKTPFCAPPSLPGQIHLT